MIKINKKEKNSLILALFIFQFGFLQPVATLIGNQSPIAIFSLLLVVYALTINKFSINKGVYVIIVIAVIIFLTSDLMFPNNRAVLNPTLKEFILKSIPALYIGSLEMDYKKFNQYILKLSIINFVILAPYPFINSYNSMDYMRFGYALVPSTLVFIYALMNDERKILWIVFTIVSSYLVVIYGSRGPLIVMTMFLVGIFIISNKIRRSTKIMLTILGVLLIVIILRFNLLGLFFDYLYFDLNIKNYTIMKYQRMFNNQFLAATSGRDQIYSGTFGLFRERVLFGHGIGGVETQITYKAHNIILQLLAENGILGILVFLYFTSIFVNLMKFSSKYSLYDLQLILVFVFSVSIGRLLLSSDYWLRPEFWILLGILMRNKSKCAKYQLMGEENDENYINIWNKT